MEDDDQLYNVLRTQVDVILPSGAGVLNAADPRVLEMAALCDGMVILYAESAALEAIASHREKGGWAVFVDADRIVLAAGDTEFAAVSLVGLPGAGQEWKIDSVLVGVAVAWALGIPG